MSSRGTVPLSAVWRMLDDCAPGYEKRARKHNWLVTWRNRQYPSLPLGPHGRRQDPDIEVGHVRKMVRHLGVSGDCAGRHIELLRTP